MACRSVRSVQGTTSRITAPRSPLRQTAPRSLVTARCVPTSSRVENAVEDSPAAVSVAAKQDLERQFQKDSALVSESSEQGVALGT